MCGDKKRCQIGEGRRVRALTQDGTNKKGIVRKLEITWCVCDSTAHSMERKSAS